jgi:hypothetical protein
LIDDLGGEESGVVHVLALGRARHPKLGMFSLIELLSNVGEVWSGEKMGLEKVVELCKER